MANPQRRWGLATKLAVLGVPLVVCALAAMALTLWLSFQLDGGVAAVNEAGRMRMQAYRLSLAVMQGDPEEVSALKSEFDQSLDLLRHGNPVRPLAVPWDGTSRERFMEVDRSWQAYSARWIAGSASDTRQLRADTQAFVATIEAFVQTVELQLAQWTSLLQFLHTGVLVVFSIWVIGLMVGAYSVVLEPVGSLHRAMGQVQRGQWNTRVSRDSTLEFDDLALGFNALIEHLEQLYGSLERKVQEKTAELHEKHERLEQLYGVSALVGRASKLDELAQAFTGAVQGIAKADGVALRWSDQANARYLILASNGLPEAMVEAENCLDAGQCYCGRPTPDDVGMRVIPIHSLPATSLRHCERAGFSSIYTVPILLHDRLLGEVNFFFRSPTEPTAAERALLESLNTQLANAMENLRHSALAREAAVSGERHHLSRELHDSIAQSLAFLKIQVNLLRDAVSGGDPAQVHTVVEEIDAGVRECYGDVRELLMHFRTRTNTEDIVPALETTLRKFEHQTGVRAVLDVESLGVPLDADVQIQVLHILQEALSNVRKHARAKQVYLRVRGQPHWRFEVEDDGLGFATDAPRAETHVGMGIMAERAQRIGARLEVDSQRHHGTKVVLVLSRA
ncbi:type IV pili methyl-accepting chemotaxis transducer N-terminal domain-containing protein [Curvibacter sp. APW13]|uniref:type IV pili methyl-accepting chemotaxis transducer N-terminal domain-containing protein n=1 Tax=Curvibacter sp. APW13 TaxID=3077236 RepID=UPI0028DE395E|nr:type IV pili methyl-accepting chemotaxis transducer N-terminal domain-containing protein [Curvibacter sp. APW13]MDT8989611.1 type IV pili methyl-accepting chemotaxis transducer N-terminal domain-containing protein [Curvibacter sp. APW13]